MGKSQQTYNKNERSKKKAKRKKEKQERREQRKLEKAEKGKLSFEDQLMYVDENGNLTKEKIDPTQRKKVKLEDINLGVPPNGHEDNIATKTGVVTMFNAEKGFGFIREEGSGESIFVHISEAYESIQERDKVSYVYGQSPKGIKAIDVTKID